MFPRKTKVTLLSPFFFLFEKKCVCGYFIETLEINFLMARMGGKFVLKQYFPDLLHFCTSFYKNQNELYSYLEALTEKISIKNPFCLR